MFLSFQTTSFAITNILNVNADVQTFIDSTWSLPESTCSGWCPSCVMSVCIEMMGSSQLYDGEIVYIPGDILVAGLIPMSQTWNRLNHTQACSGLKTSDNVDIMAEAFVYAVMKSRDQYSAMFGNATIGALLFDTCSDANRASQIMLNFESCSYNFMPNNVGQTPLPFITPVYVALDYDTEHSGILSETSSVGKLAFGLDRKGSLYNSTGVVYESYSYNFNAVTDLLHHMDWTYVGVLSSIGLSTTLDGLYESATSQNICIAYHSKISTLNKDLLDSVDAVKSSMANTIVVFGTSDDIDALFVYLTSRPVAKTWILIESRGHWLHPEEYPLQLGTIVIERYHSLESDFKNHVTNWYNREMPHYNISNEWLEKYRDARQSENIQSPILDDLTLIQASDVIRTVEISLAVLNMAVNKICGNGSGLCEELMTQQVTTEMQNIWYDHHTQTVKIDESTVLVDKYVVTNLQENGYQEVRKDIYLCCQIL